MYCIVTFSSLLPHWRSGEVFIKEGIASHFKPWLLKQDVFWF